MNYVQAAAHYGIPAHNHATHAAATDAIDLVAARSGYTIWVQKVIYVPTTVAAQAITVKDGDGTPVNVALIPSNQALPYTADFGEQGIPLTAGTKLQASNTAGPAGRWKVYAYYKLSAPKAMHAANQ